MTEWRREILSKKPKEFERLNEKFVIQRRDIVENSVIEKNTNIEQTIYECYSRTLCNEEYDTLKDSLYTPAQMKNEKNFKENDSNMLIVMSAIADLYEKVSELQEKLS